MPSSIAFMTEAWPEDPQVIAVVPVIDGTTLTPLIHAFEREAGFELRDESYAGLIPAFFNFGSAVGHYMAGDRPSVRR